MLDSSDFLQLLRKMGHDMRVPLNTIISTGDMLMEGTYDPLTAKQEKAVVRLQRNNQRLLAILDDFMTYMKADAGELMLNPKPFDPRTQLEAWMSPIDQEAKKSGITLRLTTAENVPALVTADETSIKKIIQALLWNALAHTTQGEILIASDWTPEQVWLIDIKDSGSGISADDLPHIFEPFWRGEARPQFPTAGAGLGLPLSFALAKLMDGKLFLQKTSSDGSHFCLQTPVEKKISIE
ncbi:MAG: HAMP domain-containing sensor histidine kinase [Chloroflexota bacterium]